MEEGKEIQVKPNFMISELQDRNICTFPHHWTHSPKISPEDPSHLSSALQFT